MASAASESHQASASSAERPSSAPTAGIFNSSWDFSRRLDPSCVLRMCELQVSHVQMLVPLDLDRSKQELLKSQSSGITLSISMANTRRTLRSHKLNAEGELIVDQDVVLTFNYQYVHSLKANDNNLVISLERRKRYKHRPVKGYKRLCSFVISMDEVLQTNLGGDVTLVDKHGQASARVVIQGIASLPMIVSEPDEDEDDEAWSDGVASDLDDDEFDRNGGLRGQRKSRKLNLRKLMKTFKGRRHGRQGKASPLDDVDVEDLDDLSFLEVLRMGSQAVSLYSDESDEDDEDDDDDDLPSPVVQHVNAQHRPFGGLRMLELPLPAPSSPRSKRSPVRPTSVHAQEPAPGSPTPDTRASRANRVRSLPSPTAVRAPTSLGAKLASMMPKRRERVSSNTSQSALRDRPPSTGGRSRSSSDAGPPRRTSAVEVTPTPIMPEGNVPYVVLVDEMSTGATDFANSVAGWARTSDTSSDEGGEDEVAQPLQTVAERLIRVVMPEQLPILLQQLLLTQDQAESLDSHVVVGLVGSDQFYWQVLKVYLEVVGAAAAERVISHAFFPIPASPDTSQTCWIKQLQQLDPTYSVNFCSDGWKQMMELSGNDHNTLRSICSQLHSHLNVAVTARGLAVSELLLNHAGASQQLVPFVSAVAVGDDEELDLQVDFKATDVASTHGSAAATGGKEKDKTTFKGIFRDLRVARAVHKGASATSLQLQCGLKDKKQFAQFLKRLPRRDKSSKESSVDELVDWLVCSVNERKQTLQLQVDGVTVPDVLFFKASASWPSSSKSVPLLIHNEHESQGVGLVQEAQLSVV
eukprot:m.121000 g.121000  ORF g.121000 m.121000 type:complete len:809 (+) comp15624_c0_seq1:47-2473(+)